jgi:hypothetical protein
MERHFMYVTSDGNWGSVDDLVIFDPADLHPEGVQYYWDMIDGGDGDNLFWYLNTTVEQ